MLQEIFFYIFITVGAINFLHLGFYIVGGDIYDIREFRRQKSEARAKKSRRKLPLVSIIIPAHNEELVIERCLESIRRSNYKKVEAIVHNDKSSDKTSKILAAYKKKYPKFKLRVINRRNNVGKGAGVNFAIKRYAKGELIMTLDADCVLHESAVRNTVKYFKDPRIIGVAANVRIMDSNNILGLLQKFEHMIGYRSKKFYTVTNSEFIIGGVASTYRIETMREVGFYDTDTQTEDIGLSMKIVATGNRSQRIIYAADVLAMTEGVQTFKALLKQRYRWKLGMMQNLVKHSSLFGSTDKRYSKMLTMYRVPMAYIGELILVMQPFLLGYLAYLSIHYQTTALFIGAYFTITLYVLWTIWPDEHSKLKRKLSLSFYAPVMYFIFYVMDLVQIAAIFKVLESPKQIFHTGKGGGRWVSPERAGGDAEFA